jgi:diguanylate cyclase (GGDEF)-like protein
MPFRFTPPPRPPHGPLRRARRLRRTAPFALVGGVVLTVFVATYRESLDTGDLAVLGLVAAAIIILVARAPWERIPQEAQVAAPLAVVGMIVLMQVLALPADLDVAVLLIAPVLWTALYGTLREVVVVTGLAAAAVVGLQIDEQVTGQPVGLTGWTEIVAFLGAMTLVSGFVVTARAQARVDTLTGIANRRTWDEVLDVELGWAGRHEGDVVVAVIDLDRCKAYNDAHGHSAGDAHLIECAGRWARSLRSHDLLARVGGEEFAVLLPGITESGAVRALERLASDIPAGRPVPSAWRDGTAWGTPRPS